MNKKRFSRREKWLIVSTSFFSLAVAGLGALYEWNNRIPEVKFPVYRQPNPNGATYFRAAAKLVVLPATPANAKPGSGVDLHIETSPALEPRPILYSRNYFEAYPLNRKLAYLKVNAPALAQLRRGLPLSYAHPFPFQEKPTTEAKQYNGKLRDLTRVIFVEAHAYAQQNQWDKAADSLMDAYRLFYLLPNQAPFPNPQASFQMRNQIAQEFYGLLPRLSTTKLRQCVRQMEKLQTQYPALSQMMEWEKRDLQKTLLSLIKQNDFRPLFVTYSCIGGCGITDEQYQRDLNALPAMLEIRLSWVSKPHLMNELTRCMDWHIQQAKIPYSIKKTTFPFRDPNEESTEISPLYGLIYPVYNSAESDYIKRETQDKLLMALMATYAFQKEKARLPKNLNELVPRYLSTMPLDPFSNQKLLRYKPKVCKVVIGQEKRRLTPQEEKKERQQRQGGDAPVGPPTPLPPGPIYRYMDVFRSYPVTIYSVGFNQQDDGGVAFEDKDRRGYLKYSWSVYNNRDAKADFVAGINN